MTMRIATVCKANLGPEALVHDIPPQSPPRSLTPAVPLTASGSIGLSVRVAPPRITGCSRAHRQDLCQDVGPWAQRKLRLQGGLGFRASLFLSVLRGVEGRNCGILF